ncbi:MAG TPA: A24 family peptidase [Microbacteriaceae bacterium]|nr:A24 family peptidase [Microbacteriaceae bacterium]
MAEILQLVAAGVLAAASIALAVIDIRTKRLPDRIVLPTLVVLAVLLAASAAVSGDLSSILRALAGAAVLFLLYLLISIASGGGMGFGDVKLAAVLGLATAWVGWDALVVGTAAAFVLGGLFGLVLLLLRRTDRRSAVPFGPWMLAGAWIGIALGPVVWHWYAALAGIPPAV